MRPETKEFSESVLAKWVDDTLCYLNLSGEFSGSIAKKYGTAILATREACQASVQARNDNGLNLKPKVKDLETRGVNSLLLGGENGSRYQLAKLTKKSYPEIRKLKYFRVLPHSASQACTVDTCHIYPDGASKQKRFLFYNAGQLWVRTFASNLRTKTRRIFTGTSFQDFDVHEGVWDDTWAQMITQMLWSQRYLWYVKLTYFNSASVLLATDPTGVKGFFKLRDKPEGRDRRTALLHWVREHWRKSRKIKDDEIAVRAHLRGDDEFNWFGMKGQVLIPFELDERLKNGPILP